MNIQSFKNKLTGIIEISLGYTFVFGYYDEVSGYNVKSDYPIIRVFPPEVPFYKLGFSKDQSKIPVKFFIYELLETHSDDRTAAWSEAVDKMDEILTNLNASSVGLYITKESELPKYHRDGLTTQKSVAVEFTFEMQISC
jgi:hypothetical protein